ncbi:hypothetical protein Asulf_00244 [Archaeoglobus sulfaticallidus PM70-1]|uniref:PRC-barrel domain-containing protein n=1 Tax=Archaeoglobus sulfaticallidus PM70-1 TaxID=387631 RepID=N0BDE3_9EURY|nr:DUF5749 family beta-barrel protein [Archaeoglobus sulfaticallidus]AGK60277.1 hypothetical protein Asulf_00244 [Archaeoglobus sulfaticallidus PM70-1]
MGNFDMICKFVYCNGAMVGESVDVYENMIIVKVGERFIGIPLDRVEKVDAENIHISEFDEDEAKEVGERWFNEKSKPVSIEELNVFGFGEN